MINKFLVVIGKSTKRPGLFQRIGCLLLLVPGMASANCDEARAKLANARNDFHRTVTSVRAAEARFARSGCPESATSNRYTSGSRVDPVAELERQNQAELNAALAELERQRAAELRALAEEEARQKAEEVDSERYAEVLSSLERRYPELNPDSPKFSAEKTNSVADAMIPLVNLGYRRSMALEMAVAQVFNTGGGWVAQPPPKNYVPPKPPKKSCPSQINRKFYRDCNGAVIEGTAPD